jgi:DNA polymerase III epsilon subunit family exonuclease
MIEFIIVIALLIFLFMMFYFSSRSPKALDENTFKEPLIRSDLEMLRSSKEARSPEVPVASPVPSSGSPCDLEPNRWFLPEEFVVFDLETTGFNAGSAEIIEIGAIRISRDFKMKRSFECLLQIEGRLPRKIVEITGITRKMINKDGRDADEAIGEFLQFVGDLPLVAYNVKFDRSFLEAAASKRGHIIRNEFHCALEKARLAWPGRASYKLVDIARDGQLSSDGTHRALSDARRALIVYAAAMTIIHSKN